MSPWSQLLGPAQHPAAPSQSKVTATHLICHPDWHPEMKTWMHTNSMWCERNPEVIDAEESGITGSIPWLSMGWLIPPQGHQYTCQVISCHGNEYVGWTGAPLNIEMSSYQYLNSHYKDKTVVNSLIYIMEIHSWKDGLDIETNPMSLSSIVIYFNYLCYFNVEKWWVILMYFPIAQNNSGHKWSTDFHYRQPAYRRPGNSRVFVFIIGLFILSPRV